ncbi:MAG TPA: trypsin-like peptidase domain-containing protein [Chloroflexota bacterium]|nr:trypsin-like peptidase domain-containing protein [Chloroflexota bacterium]
MSATERGSGFSWRVIAAVLVGALIIGALGEALLQPRLAPLATSAESRASAAVSSVMAPTRAVATATSPAAQDSSTRPGSGAVLTSAASPPLTAVGDEPYIAVVQKAGPSVVTVVNQLSASSAPLGQLPQPEALGSGVIADADGHIITNNHVVVGNGTFQVIFSDARKVSAQLVGRDSISDLAVLKVDGGVPAVATFGDSTQLMPGQQVVAIGSALGNFRNTVTHGIVSGLNRTLTDPSGPGLTGLIQTDAPINHGNSGGPLLNLRGEVIGINTAVVRTTGLTGDVTEGLGFAIPSATVKQIADELIRTGTVVRPFLGISYQELSPQSAAYFGLGSIDGALIKSVELGSPADKAGIKTGDVITAIDGTKLDEEHALSSVLVTHKVGDTIQLSITRDQQNLSLSVTLAQRPASAQ